MLKSGRNYLLRFRIGKKPKGDAGSGINVEWQEEITIRYPMTIQFSIVRGDFAVFDSCSIQLTNLNEKTRAKLYRDIFDLSKYIEIQFFAGYGDDVSALPLIFFGEVWECYSYKRGAGTDFLTNISCLTGLHGGTYSQSNVTFDKGTAPLDVIKKLCHDVGYPLLGYSKSIVDAIPPLRRKTSFCGNSLKCLKDFVCPVDNAGKIVKIVNNGIYIMGENSVIGQKALLLSAESGLLGYPKRRNMFIDVEMLFEPRIQQSQMVQLTSSIDKFFNGLWTVKAFTHQGVISGAVGGQCMTTIALYSGTKSFNWVTEVKNGK